MTSRVLRWPCGSMGWMRMRSCHVLACASLAFLASCAAAKKVAVKEVIFDSAIADIQWLAPEQKTVLVQTSKGRLYRSTNAGEAWAEITELLASAVDPEGRDPGTPSGIEVDQISKSPADHNTVMVAGTGHSHFVSSDAGATWKRLKHQSPIHTFIFHKTRKSWALLSTWTSACEGKFAAPKKSNDDDDDDKEAEGPCRHMLYITKNLGRTFSLVSSYVVQFSWGNIAHNQQDRIYFTHFRQKDGDQKKLTLWSPDVDFAYTDDYGKKVQRLVHHGNKFLISHGFIFVAKLKDQKGQTVSLHTSADGGRTFEMAKLPQEIDEKSYTVLDTSEGAVMLHVNHGAKEVPHNVGNVYVSDKDGVRFTLSLPNNVRGSAGDCEFDKVLSLEGVYLANFKDISHLETAKADYEDETGGAAEVDSKRSSRAKDESVVRTVISFDKGGVWSLLKPPTIDSVGKKIECPPEKCWLHLHGITNFKNFAPFYSIENAVGIIMGTGNVGASLRFEQDEVNTYLSRDGGVTWHEAHKGAFIYEFGDHGGILVMADDIKKTKQVVFSWNEGQSWYDFEVSDNSLEVDNIVTEPNATSTTFLMYGTRGETGVLYQLDFAALDQKPCQGIWAADSVASDYEIWVPSDLATSNKEEKCMLGRQVSYTRRKQTSECFNGEKFERPVKRKNCACTQEDYECEMGFTRKVGSMECKFANDGSVPFPPTCTSSDFFYVDAHRKVIGDTCEGGWAPQKAAVPCPPSSKMSKGAYSVLGTVSMLAAVMGVVTFLSRSEQFKGYFANYGFSAHTGVKYNMIGNKAPENALDSVGEFVDADRDGFDDSPPQLRAYSDYTGGSDKRDRRQGGREVSRESSRRADTAAAPRRLDTAAAQVPRLKRPPGPAASAIGGGAVDDLDDLGLL